MNNGLSPDAILKLAAGLAGDAFQPKGGIIPVHRPLLTAQGIKAPSPNG